MSTRIFPPGLEFEVCDAEQFRLAGRQAPGIREMPQTESAGEQETQNAIPW
jgi:hypothetical protein